METSHMKMFAKNNPWRPIYLACVLFLVIGYLFYFLAYLFPTPQWGRELMEWAMPTVKALDTAARVGVIRGTDSFPAQVVTLYCALGTFLLMGWCLFWLCGTQLLREIVLQGYTKHLPLKDRSRTKLFFVGVFSACTSFFFLSLFWVEFTKITWREIAFYSSKISSITFLMVLVIFASLLMSLAPLIIFISLLKRPNFYKSES